MNPIPNGDTDIRARVVAILADELDADVMGDAGPTDDTRLFEEMGLDWHAGQTRELDLDAAG